jgi:hypothetical protein
VLGAFWEEGYQHSGRGPGGEDDGLDRGDRERSRASSKCPPSSSTDVIGSGPLGPWAPGPEVQLGLPGRDPLPDSGAQCLQFVLIVRRSDVLDDPSDALTLDDGTLFSRQTLCLTARRPSASWFPVPKSAGRRTSGLAGL